jgi:hexokinase
MPSGEVDTPYLPLAMTFSFPVEQTALDSGVLLTWTKGFAAKNAIGKDVVKLLQDAFDRKHIHVKCVALVNDVSLFHPRCPNLDRLHFSRDHVC